MVGAKDDIDARFCGAHEAGDRPPSQYQGVLLELPKRHCAIIDAQFLGAGAKIAEDACLW